MTKYKVNGGDKSERGNKVISPEVERNPLGDERERGMDTYRNVGSRPGTQLGVRIADPNTTPSNNVHNKSTTLPYLSHQPHYSFRNPVIR